MADENIHIRYILSVRDRNSRAVLDADRRVRRSTEQTTQSFNRQDRATDRLAKSATAMAGKVVRAANGQGRAQRAAEGTTRAIRGQTAATDRAARSANGLAASAGRVAGAEGRAARAASGFTRTINRQTRATTQQTRATTQLARSTDRARRSTQQNTRATRVQTHEQDKSERSFYRLGTATDRFNSRILASVNVMRLLKWPALAAGAGLLAGGLGSVGGAAIGMMASLRPAAGVLAAYPALISAVAQGTGVWRLATKDVSEALGGNKKAMERLTPPAKDFVKTLKGMKPELRSVQMAAQRGLFPGVVSGIKSAMNNLGVFRRVVGDTGRVLGGLARDAGRALGSREWGRDIAIQGRRNTVTIDRLGRSFGNVFSAIRHVTIAAGPLVDWITKGTLAWSRHVDASAKAGRESGRLGRFFSRTVWTLQRLVGITRNVGGGLGGMFRAAEPAGRRILVIFERATKRFRDLTNSARGQNAMRRYFNDAVPGIVATGRLLTSIVMMMIRVSAATQKTWVPMADLMRTELVPAMERFFIALGNALGPAMVRTLTSVVNLFTTLAETGAGPLAVVVKTLGVFADIVNTALHVPVIRQLTFGLMGLFAVFAAARMVGAVTGITSVVRGINSLAKSYRSLKAAQAAGTAVGPVGRAFTKMGDIAVGAGRRIRGALSRAFSIGRQAARRGAAAAMDWATATSIRVNRAAGRIRGAIGRAFSAGRAAARRGVEAAADWASSAGGRVRRGASRIRSAIGRAFSAGRAAARRGIEAAVDWAGAAMGRVRRGAGRIRSAIGRAFHAGRVAARRGIEAGVDWASGAMGRVRRGAGRLRSAIGRAFNAGRAAARRGVEAGVDWAAGAMGRVRRGARRLRSAIGRAFSAGRQAVRAGVNAATDWAGSAIGGVRRRTGRVRAALRRAMTAGRNAVRAGTEAAAGWVGSAVGGIRSRSGRVRNALRRAMVRGRFWVGAATDAAAGWVGGVAGGVRARSRRVSTALRRAMLRGRFWIAAATEAAAGWVGSFVSSRGGITDRRNTGRMHNAGRVAGSAVGRGIVVGIALALPAIAGEIVKAVERAGRRVGGLPGRVISGTVRRRGTGLNRAGFQAGGVVGHPGVRPGRVVPGVGRGDIIPAALEPGEFVIKRDTVRALTVSALQRLNEDPLEGILQIIAGQIGQAVPSIRRVGGKSQRRLPGNLARLQAGGVVPQPRPTATTARTRIRAEVRAAAVPIRQGVQRAVAIATGRDPIVTAAERQRVLVARSATRQRRHVELEMRRQTRGSEREASRMVRNVDRHTGRLHRSTLRDITRMRRGVERDFAGMNRATTRQSQLMERGVIRNALQMHIGAGRQVDRLRVGATRDLVQLARAAERQSQVMERGVIRNSAQMGHGAGRQIDRFRVGASRDFVQLSRAAGRQSQLMERGVIRNALQMGRGAGRHIDRFRVGAGRDLVQLARTAGRQSQAMERGVIRNALQMGRGAGRQIDRFRAGATRDFVQLSRASTRQTQAMERGVIRNALQMGRGAGRHVDRLRVGATRDFVQLNRSAVRQAQGMGRGVGRQMVSMNREGSRQSQSLNRNVQRQFISMHTNSARHARAMNSNVQRQLISMRVQGGRQTDAFRRTVARSFQSMDRAVAAGAGYVKIAVNAALRGLGGRPVTLNVPRPPNLGRQQGGGVRRFARGGQLPGSGREDTVPVMAAPGEWFLTRHQAKVADAALRMSGAARGLGDLVRRENTSHRTAVGRLSRLDHGRGVSMSPQERHHTFGADHQRGGGIAVPRYGGAPLRAQWGLRGPAQALYHSLKRKGFAPTSGFRGGNPRSFHSRGLAIDYGDSRNNLRRLWPILYASRRKFAELFGPTYLRPPTLMQFGRGFRSGRLQADHQDHIHVAATGKIGPLGEAEDVPKIGVRGPVGMLRDIAQRAIDRIRVAANAKIAKEYDLTGGFSGGPAGRGSWSVARLAALWRSVGGPARVARMMGAIAMAESGGRPNITGGGTGSDDGRGLWQIEWPVWRNTFRGANPLNPRDNAKMALHIYRAQGLRAWTVYRTGAYRRYMQRGGMIANAGLGPVPPPPDGQRPRWAGWRARGMNEVVRRPTVIGVGERGPERVTVTPQRFQRGGTAFDSNLHRFASTSTSPPNSRAARVRESALGRQIGAMSQSLLDAAYSHLMRHLALARRTRTRVDDARIQRLLALVARRQAQLTEQLISAPVTGSTSRLGDLTRLLSNLRRAPWGSRQAGRAMAAFRSNVARATEATLLASYDSIRALQARNRDRRVATRYSSMIAAITARAPQVVQLSQLRQVAFGRLSGRSIEAIRRSFGRLSTALTDRLTGQLVDYYRSTRANTVQLGRVAPVLLARASSAAVLAAANRARAVVASASRSTSAASRHVRSHMQSLLKHITTVATARIARLQQAIPDIEARTQLRNTEFETFELRQRLAGTYEGGGLAREQFIRRRVIPALQAQLTNLQDQLNLEIARGGSAERIRELRQAVQEGTNELLQAQLNAMEQVAENTDALRAFGGTLGFEFGSSVWTDTLRTSVGR